MQSKKSSVIESVASTILGYIIAVVLYMIVLPMFGHNTNFTESVMLTFIFATASIIRGYVVRRLFNYLLLNGLMK